MNEYTSIIIACYSCRKRLNFRKEAYEGLLNAGLSKREAMDEIGLKSICCRSFFISPPVMIEFKDDTEIIRDIAESSKVDRGEKKKEYLFLPTTISMPTYNYTESPQRGVEAGISLSSVTEIMKGQTYLAR